MMNIVRIPARYTPTGASTYDGNPFIEALPAMEQSKGSIMDRIAHFPPKATAEDRRKGELVRLAELSRINDIVYPFAAYQRAAVNLTMNVREAYVARNPLHAEDRRRRHAIAEAADTGDDKMLPTDWKSSARGQTLLGISGSGKTTLAEAFSLPYQVVIDHESYHGTRLKCIQIPWIKLRVPHDATLKSLCLQFFGVIDQCLGTTSYQKHASTVRNVARMALLLYTVAAATSIGAVFIDELQNLKSARSAHADVVLNLFSEMIELGGVTVVVAGTPAVGDVLTKNVRNMRKLATGGTNKFEAMKLGDLEFDGYCETLWDYRFVRNTGPLTPAIRTAWHRASAGNPAFTTLAFVLAQRMEIGGREVLDETSFERVAKTDMAVLGPAIAALNVGTNERLIAFEDLLFKEGISALTAQVGWAPPEQFGEAREEFEELSDGAASTHSSKPVRAVASRSAVRTSVELPIEIPALR